MSFRPELASFDLTASDLVYCHRTLVVGRFGIGQANSLVTLLVQFGGKFRTAGFDDSAAQHDVRLVGSVVFQKLFVVRDDQDAHPGAADFGDALAGQPNGVGIEAAIGFVEHRESRLQHRQLQNLGPLHFAAGKAVVDVSLGELGIDSQLLHLGPQFLAEILHRNQRLRFPCDPGGERSSPHDARNRPSSRPARPPAAETP